MKGTKAKVLYKTANGQIVPGVTTVLGVLAKPALIHWAWKLGMEGIDYKKFRDKAAGIGTLAHYLVECDLSGSTPELSTYSADDINLAENCLLSYYEWRKGKTVKPIYTEWPCVSERWKFGGTLDFYGEIDGQLTLLDLKTGKAIYDEHTMQLAAYVQLLKEQGCPVQKIRVLRIGRDETEGFEERLTAIEQLKPYWEAFRHALGIYNVQKKIKKAV